MKKTAMALAMGLGLMAAAQNAQSASPYPLPQLSFTPNQLAVSLQQAEVDIEWFNHVNQYLHLPQQHWGDCMENWSDLARTRGGMSAAKAHQHAVEVCSFEVTAYYQCLHNKPLNYASACLQYRFLEQEASVD